MKNIIGEIYEGRLFPTERLEPKQPEYDKLNEKITDYMKMWQEKLTKEDYLRLDELMVLRAEAAFDEANTSFCHGFKMGAMIMIEVFTGADDLVKS